MAESVAVRFCGVELVLPYDLPFQNDGTCLTLDLSAGFSGKLKIIPAPSPPPPELERLPSCQNPQGTTCIPSPAIEASRPAVAAPPGSAKPAQQALVIEDSQPCTQDGLPSWFHRPLEPVAHAEPDRTTTGTDQLLCEKASSHQQAAEMQLEDKTILAQIHASPGHQGQAKESASRSAQEQAEAQPSLDAAAAPEHSQGTSIGPSAPEDFSHADLQKSPAGDLDGPVSIAQADASAEPGSAGDRQAEPHPADVKPHKTPAAASRPAEKENTPGNMQQNPTGQAKRKPGARPPNTGGKRSGKKLKRTPEQRPQEISLRWRPLECKAAAEEDGLPTERWGGTFTALDDHRVCLYGGNSIEQQLGDTWVLDVARATWKRVPVQDDAGKAWHTAEVVNSPEGKQLLVFGGERIKATVDGGPDQDHDDEDDLEPLADVCQLDWGANLWLTLPMTGESGKLLPHRSGHSTTLLPDNRVLLFGGVDEDGRFRNDAYLMDAQRLNCFSLGGIIKGAPPKPRAYHSATLVGERIIVLGGLSNRAWSFKEVYSLSLEGWTWKEHTAEVEGEPPAARSGHSTVALPGDRHLLVFGGGFVPDDIFYSNVAVLDTLTWTWSSPTPQGIARPVARGGHGMAAVKLPDGGAALVMHGGRAPGERLCLDTWLLELTMS